MKQNICIIYLLLLTIVKANANGVKIGNLHYILDETDKTASVTFTQMDNTFLDIYQNPINDEEYVGDILVPDAINYKGKSYIVTKIADGAFEGSKISSIRIPSSITSIGENAFAYCDSLVSITIPNGVKSIGNWAFAYCNSLTSITIPNGVTSIGAWMFYSCDSLTSVVIPYGVTSLGKACFSKCRALSSVAIPSSVTTIETMAFYNCKSLSSISVPRSVISIGRNAFYGVANIVYSGTLNGKPWGAKNINQDQTTIFALSPIEDRGRDFNPISRPLCYILSPETGDFYTTPTVRIHYKAVIPSMGQYSVRFKVNGKEVQPKLIDATKGASVEHGTEVELPMPQNEGITTNVEVQIFDSDSIIWAHKDINLEYRKEGNPSLHVLAVGLNEYKVEGFHQLEYAEKDARDFISTIIEMADRDKYKSVDTTLIIGSAAHRDSLVEQITKLEECIEPLDVVMVFFSGHGTVENDRSYFLTYNAKYTRQGLPMSEISYFIESMRKKECSVYLFMDACYSGMMPLERSKGPVKDIPSKAVTVGYYSCAKDEHSIERTDLENGVFTYAIKDGLKELTVDQITIYKLYNYIRERVADDTHDRQNPSMHYLGGGKDYIIFYKKK